jgi:hypothetical protein
MKVFSRGDVSINYWRFGQLPSELIAQLNELKNKNWRPDEVYLEGFTTFWWEGVTEAISLVREKFPETRIILCGAYPSLATEHAANHSGADIIVVGDLEGLSGLSLDLSLYPSRPLFTYLSIGTSRRSSYDLVEEFLSKATPKNEKEGIRQFAFADHDIVSRFPDQFHALLQTVIDRKIKANFYALGNLYPQDFVNDPELADLLFRAGFKQIVFADDRSYPFTEEAREKQLELYHHAIEYCISAGYRSRTETLVGSACIGRPGEQMEEITSFITKLAHVAGSLIVVPYQPAPLECKSDLPLEYQNGKLFPCAEDNGLSYRIYQDLLGLAAVFNSKYRSHTFDFLGNGLISRLVQSSIATKSWDPRNSPDTLKERPVTIGWFNKEGKWVRS